MLGNRATTVLAIGALSLFFIYKRHLGELKSVSYVFLVIIFLFVTLLCLELSRDSGTNRPTLAEVSKFRVDVHLPTAITIITFAYMF